jgi:hypothetical protein
MICGRVSPVAEAFVVVSGSAALVLEVASGMAPRARGTSGA